MLFAAIDIGSNAARLLFSNVYIRNGERIVKKASFIRVPLRLGMEVFETGRLSEKKINKLIATIRAFKNLIDVYEPVSFRACATAAMREAQNNKEIILRVQKETGVKIEIIDGLMEAAMIGATNNIETKEKYNALLFVDVGGGSTELTVLEKTPDGNKLVDSRSFKLGTIRILNNKAADSEWMQLKEWSKDLRKKYQQIFCIGTGGNINKIVKEYGKRTDKVVTYENLIYAYEHLNKYSIEERIEVLGLNPDRADVIAPAALIYLSVMKWGKIQAMYVPKIGLSDGLIHLQYNEHTQIKAVEN